MTRKCNAHELRTVVLPVLISDLEEAKYMMKITTNDSVKRDLLRKIQATEEEIEFVKAKIYQLENPVTMEAENIQTRRTIKAPIDRKKSKAS